MNNLKLMLTLLLITFTTLTGCDVIGGIFNFGVGVGVLLVVIVLVVIFLIARRGRRGV
jgi:hypothetical protein